MSLIELSVSQIKSQLEGWCLNSLRMFSRTLGVGFLELTSFQVKLIEISFR